MQLYLLWLIRTSTSASSTGAILCRFRGDDAADELTTGLSFPCSNLFQKEKQVNVSSTDFFLAELQHDIQLHVRHSIISHATDSCHILYAKEKSANSVR